MASTSTNKQPLFIDRVFHYAKLLDEAYNNGLDVIGANKAELIVDGIGTDGGIIEDIYLISRGKGHTVNLYMSTARDYLRDNEGIFIGSIVSPTTEKEKIHWSGMPFVLAPVPQVGTNSANQAFYLPKNHVLWAARQSDTKAEDAPIIGCQGGWY